MPSNACGKAEQAGDSASLELVARAGLIAYGVVHLLICWLAVRIAWSASGSKSADTSGALKTLADQPFGKILLWLVAIGLVALALWQASEAIWGYRNREGAKRVRKQATSAATAIIYAALGVSAASVALGSGSSSSQSQKQVTSGVLAWPAGRVIVVVAGLIIIGAGVAQVVKGVKTAFAEEIDTSSMSPVAGNGVARLGQIGYIARGVALGLVGGSAQLCHVDLRPPEGARVRRRDADDRGATVRQVSAHGGGARIRGVRRVRDPPVAIPSDGTRAAATERVARETILETPATGRLARAVGPTIMGALRTARRRPD